MLLKLFDSFMIFYGKRFEVHQKVLVSKTKAGQIGISKL